MNASSIYAIKNKKFVKCKNEKYYGPSPDLSMDKIRLTINV